MTPDIEPGYFTGPDGHGVLTLWHGVPGDARKVLSLDDIDPEDHDIWDDLVQGVVGGRAEHSAATSERIAEIRADPEADLAKARAALDAANKRIAALEEINRRLDFLDDDPPASVAEFFARRESAPCRGTHRGPEGPNEDLAQCWHCGDISFSMRPWGETFGHHLDDCSLPIDHESYCQPGGPGHPVAKKVRG